MQPIGVIYITLFRVNLQYKFPVWLNLPSSQPLTWPKHSSMPSQEINSGFSPQSALRPAITTAHQRFENQSSGIVLSELYIREVCSVAISFWLMTFPYCHSMNKNLRCQVILIHLAILLSRYWDIGNKTKISRYLSPILQQNFFNEICKKTGSGVLTLLLMCIPLFLLKYLR